MRAILIDPQARRISEVQYTGDYRNIYTHIGANTFDIVHLNRGGDTLFVDDEGLLKPNYYFQWVPADHLIILAGKGLILGTNAEGDSIATKMPLVDVDMAVRFLTAQEARELARNA